MTIAADEGSVKLAAAEDVDAGRARAGDGRWLTLLGVADVILAALLATPALAQALMPAGLPTAPPTAVLGAAQGWEAQTLGLLLGLGGRLGVALRDLPRMLGELSSANVRGSTLERNRHILLEELRGRLQQDTRPLLVTIEGLSGAGKTTLAQAILDDGLGLASRDLIAIETGEFDTLKFTVQHAPLTRPRAVVYETIHAGQDLDRLRKQGVIDENEWQIVRVRMKHRRAAIVSMTGGPEEDRVKKMGTLLFFLGARLKNRSVPIFSARAEVVMAEQERLLAGIPTVPAFESVLPGTAVAGWRRVWSSLRTFARKAVHGRHLWEILLAAVAGLAAMRKLMGGSVDPLSLALLAGALVLALPMFTDRDDELMRRIRALSRRAKGSPEATVISLMGLRQVKLEALEGLELLFHMVRRERSKAEAAPYLEAIEDGVLAAVSDPSAQIRGVALTLLGQYFTTERSILSIAAIAGNSGFDPPTRVHALDALGNVLGALRDRARANSYSSAEIRLLNGLRRAIEQTLQAVAAEEGSAAINLRKEALRLLGNAFHSGETIAVVHRQALQKTEDLAVLQAAVRALSRIGRRVRPAAMLDRLLDIQRQWRTWKRWQFLKPVMEEALAVLRRGLGRRMNPPRVLRTVLALIALSALLGTAAPMLSAQTGIPLLIIAGRTLLLSQPFDVGDLDVSIVPATAFLSVQLELRVRSSLAVDKSS